MYDLTGQLFFTAFEEGAVLDDGQYKLLPHQLKTIYHIGLYAAT